MSSAKTVQLQLDCARNWRFTTGARVRLCERLDVPDGLQAVVDVLGKTDEDESERLVRLQSKDSFQKLAALIWCGQIPTEELLSYEDLLEVLDDAIILEALPVMTEAIQASRNPTNAPESKALVTV